MKTWKRRKLEAKDGYYFSDGTKIAPDEWEKILQAQRTVQANLTIGYSLQKP